MSVKGRILCLHGFAQTGKIFAEKSSGIRKLLKKKNYETIYIDAPIKLKINELPFTPTTIPEDENFGFAWYRLNEGKIEDSINLINKTFQEKGPFDGIIGFSQGAALAFVFANLFHSKFPSLKFIMMFSSYSFYDDDYLSKLDPNLYRDLYLQKLGLRSMHIYGKNDNVIKSQLSIKLANNYCEKGTATLFEQPGGHFIPNSKPLCRGWIEWIEESMSQ
ncbi:alpha/beta hydrolase [Ascoidea rubescens DSM 1968]|uniref:FSH1-domain-containing protein n=1 Tax=Ascoidea rubescens DSM 1968 TaxID=1344418 RepID=A0A1D2VAR9_9ASCO|nr:FSH1-domain-containing protein [Ascoidea rubescens DSM 1968]ODV58701.1 FSH1-domain-containing protein [Ascoidea rubescens DSM 1968]